MSAMGLTAGLQALLGGMTEAGKQRRAFQRESIDRSREQSEKLYQLGQQNEAQQWNRDAATRATTQEGDRQAELRRIEAERKKEEENKKSAYIRNTLAPIAEAKVKYDGAIAAYNAIDPRDFLKREEAYKELLRTRGSYESALSTNKSLLKEDRSYGIQDWNPYIDTFAPKGDLPSRPARISRAVAPVTGAAGPAGPAGPAVEPTKAGVTLPAGAPLRTQPASPSPPPPPPPVGSAGLPFIAPPMIGMPNMPIGANVPPRPTVPQPQQPYPFDPSAARNFLPDTSMLGSRGFILPTTAPRSPMVAPRPAVPPPPTWDESRGKLTKRFFPEEDYLDYAQLGDLTPEVDKEVDRLIKKAGEGFTFPVDDTLHPSKWLPTVAGKFRERALNPAFLESELSAMNYGNKRELIPHILERMGMRFQNDPTFLPAEVRKALTEDATSTADRRYKSEAEKRAEAAAGFAAKAEAREAGKYGYETGKGREMKEEEQRVSIANTRAITAQHLASSKRAAAEVKSQKPFYEKQSNVSKIVDNDLDRYYKFIESAEKQITGAPTSGSAYSRPRAGSAGAPKGSPAFPALGNMKARMQQIRADVIAKTLAGDTNAIAGLNDRWNNLRKEYVNKHPVLGQYLGDVSDANLTTGKPRLPSEQ
jgi:hypothetical protein